MSKNLQIFFRQITDDFNAEFHNDFLKEFSDIYNLKSFLKERTYVSKTLKIRYVLTLC